MSHRYTKRMMTIKSPAYGLNEILIIKINGSGRRLCLLKVKGGFTLVFIDEKNVLAYSLRLRTLCSWLSTFKNRSGFKAKYKKESNIYLQSRIRVVIFNRRDRCFQTPSFFPCIRIVINRTVHIGPFIFFQIAEIMSRTLCNLVYIQYTIAIFVQQFERLLGIFF
jgi:hypothetical protein